MYNLDEEKKAIDENKQAFLDFVEKCLDTEEFINLMPSCRLTNLHKQN